MSPFGCAEQVLFACELLSDRIVFAIGLCATWLPVVPQMASGLPATVYVPRLCVMTRLCSLPVVRAFDLGTGRTACLLVLPITPESICLNLQETFRCEALLGLMKAVTPVASVVMLFILTLFGILVPLCAIIVTMPPPWKVEVSRLLARLLH